MFVNLNNLRPIWWFVRWRWGFVHAEQRSIFKLCLTKYHAIQTYGVVEILTSALKGKWSTSPSAIFDRFRATLVGSPLLHHHSIYFIKLCLLEIYKMITQSGLNVKTSDTKTHFKTAYSISKPCSSWVLNELLLTILCDLQWLFYSINTHHFKNWCCLRSTCNSCRHRNHLLYLVQNCHHYLKNSLSIQFRLLEKSS